MKFPLTEKYRRWIWNCQQCSTCQKGPQNPYLPTGATPDRICPSYDKYKRLSYSAQGRIALARAFLSDQLEITDDVVASFYECTLCGACGPQRFGRPGCCVERMQVPMFRDIRSDFVKMGKASPVPYVKTTAAIRDTGNRFGSKIKRSKWVPEEMSFPATSDLVYFAGCVASFKNKAIAQATVTLLKHAKIDFTILGDEEYCCGNPLVNSGQMEDFEVVVRHNVERIKKTGAKKIITSCACCYNVLKFRYPEVTGDVSFEVVHSTELLSDLIDEGLIRPEKSMTGKVTYHDPCHLTRLGSPDAPVFEEPRKVIKSIQGITFIEMEGNGEFTQCCGRNPVELPELSLHSGINRLKDALAAGVDTIITSCSFCDWNLNRAARKFNSDMKIFDISVLLCKSI